MTLPNRLAAVCASLALAAVSCGGPPEVDPKVRTDLEARAATAADELMSTLMGELSSAMAKGGPEGAVRVCGDVAQRVAAQSAARDVKVRRTSLRFRNPENAPDAFEREILEEWAAGRVAEHSEIVDGPAGRELRWMRPIRIKSVCTPCHGAPDKLPEGVRTALKERYPDDLATGFADGDLRGAFSVRVPVPR